MIIENERHQLLEQLFPAGIPRLWCPPLTHFAAPRQPDPQRIGSHLQSIAPHVKGILVPGSTGEGWEMNDEEIHGLLEIVLAVVAELDIRVLIGALKPDVDTTLSCIDTVMTRLRDRAGSQDDLTALRQAQVVGFTVCAPTGPDVSQSAIRLALSRVLDRGLPVALYQLPQVTQNEMSSDTVESLASNYPNFILLKDTSGNDRVAGSSPDLGGVFLVRGAEGQYDRWTRSGGGPYDGLLLSTANVFAAELSQVLTLLDTRNGAAAHDLSERVQAVVDYCFSMVAEFPVGNPFTNANKTLDHVRAFGSRATRVPLPRLHNGMRLSGDFVEKAMQILAQYGLLWQQGYEDPVVE